MVLLVLASNLLVNLRVDPQTKTDQAIKITEGGELDASRMATIIARVNR